MLHHKHYLGSLSPPTDNRIIDINVYYLLQITCNHNVEAMWTRSIVTPSQRLGILQFQESGSFVNGFNFHSIKSIMARNLMIVDLLLSHTSIWIAETWNCPGDQVSIGDQQSNKNQIPWNPGFMTLSLKRLIIRMALWSSRFLLWILCVGTEKECNSSEDLPLHV